MKKILTLSIIIALTLALTPVMAQPDRTTPAPKPTAQDRRVARVQVLMDQMPAESIVALNTALDVIQTELTAKGSTMKAKRIVFDALENLWQVKALQAQRDQILSNEIAADGDPIIEALESQIITIDATRAAEFGR